MTDDRRETAFATALAAARDAGADDVELSYTGTTLQFARFASSRFTQVGATTTDALRIRVLCGGRLGSQLTATLDPARIAAAAAAAVEVARLTPPIEVAMSFGQPDPGQPAVEPAAPPEIPESLTARHAPGALAPAFDRAAADGVEFAGSLKVKSRVVAVRTAAGLRRDFADANADLQMIGLCGDGSGFAASFGPADRPIDIARVAEAAADKALRSRNPTTVEPGRYDVVLGPEAIAELLEWMGMASFGANSLIDETSLLTGREGQKLGPADLTLCDRTDDDELDFDAEGTRRTPVSFLDAGIAGRPVTDRITAARLGDPRGSTGHAPSITEEDQLGPSPVHLRLEPGDESDADLIGSVTRGLFITRFHYVNGLLDTRRATTTGMTRDGTFLIEKGKLGRAVRNLRFTEHILDALAHHGGLGREARNVPYWWSEGGMVTTPSVLLPGFHFTGASR